MDPLLTERTPRVVSASKLLRSAGRRKAGQFLAEGPNAVEAAIATDRAREIFVTELGAERLRSFPRTNSVHGDVPVWEVTERAMRSLSDTVTPPGLVARCDVFELPLPERPRLIAMPIEVSEPGNAGTLIRVADAVGADAMLLGGQSVDPFNGKVIRASAGSSFYLPVARIADPLAEVERLRDTGMTILAAAGQGETDLDTADDILAANVVWLFGNEAHGLPDDLLAAADYRVAIPIRGRAESLNLATAASICLYATARAQHR